ncbi:MAG: hypothetical protein COA50_16770 [Flavobacteriaceae bacterium]|nr:MAG: hypothetical protein COA50_16770 [Flavobacteriaceae bacterium]
MKPAELFKARLCRAHFMEIFDEYFQDGSAIGRDGVRLSVFQAEIDSEIDIILRKVGSGTYKFTSYKEKLILKGANKSPRQISIPTIRDKLVLKFLSLLLAEIYPDHVTKPPHEFIKNIHRESASRPPTTSYLRLDIQNYFPSIDHKIMLRVLRQKIRQKNLLAVIFSALETPTGRKKDHSNPITIGVPQGLSISNILSSIYLAGIDEQMRAIPNSEYFRFVDDILVIADNSTAATLSREIPSTLKSKRKIICHKVGEGSKSTLLPISRGIDYLGYYFCGDIIQVRKTSFNKMFGNLMKLFTGMKYRKNRGPLIWKMNLRISGCIFEGRKIGWIFFFIQSNNTQQLKQLDAFIASRAKVVLEEADCERLKKFTKAYHEIRHNYRYSSYYPNFDNFDEGQKRAQIAILIPRKPTSEIDLLTGDDLDDLFKRCISKEISELEKDMMEVFS